MTPLPSPWDTTPGLTERLIELHAAPENYPFAEIAKKLSAEFNLAITKNACIGKSRRIGMPPREAKAPPTQPRIYKYKPRPQRKPARHPEGLITIYQLRDFVDCKWPIGRWPDILFCGEQQMEGRVYCAKHCEIAYHPNKRQGA